jgi:hypothetical protein
MSSPQADVSKCCRACSSWHLPQPLDPQAAKTYGFVVVVTARQVGPHDHRQQDTILDDH